MIPSLGLTEIRLDPFILVLCFVAMYGYMALVIPYRRHGRCQRPIVGPCRASCHNVE